MKKFLLGAVLVTAIMITGTHSAQAFSFSAFWNSLFGNSQVNNADLGASVYGAKTTGTETSKTETSQTTDRETGSEQVSAKNGDLTVFTLDPSAITTNTALLSGSVQKPLGEDWSQSTWVASNYRIYYTTTNVWNTGNITYVNPDNHTDNGITRTFSKTAFLSPNTTYYVRACKRASIYNLFPSTLGGFENSERCGQVKTFTTGAVPTNPSDTVMGCTDTTPAVGRKLSVSEKSQVWVTSQAPNLTNNTVWVPLGDFKISDITASICNTKEIVLTAIGADPEVYFNSIKIEEVNGLTGSTLGTFSVTTSADFGSQTVNGEYIKAINLSGSNTLSLQPNQQRYFRISGLKKVPMSTTVYPISFGIRAMVHSGGFPVQVTGLPKFNKVLIVN